MTIISHTRMQVRVCILINSSALPGPQQLPHIVILASRVVLMSLAMPLCHPATSLSQISVQKVRDHLSRHWFSFIHTSCANTCSGFVVTYRPYINHALRSPSPSGSSSLLILCLLFAFTQFSRHKYTRLAVEMTTMHVDMMINMIVAIL